MVEQTGDELGGEVVQLEVPKERQDRVLHTLEQLSIGATDEQDEDIGLLADQLMEA